MNYILYHILRFFRSLMFWIPKSETEILIDRSEKIVRMHENLLNRFLTEKITYQKYIKDSNEIIDLCDDALDWCKHPDFVAENALEEDIKEQVILILTEIKTGLKNYR